MLKASFANRNVKYVSNAEDQIAQELMNRGYRLETQVPVCWKEFSDMLIRVVDHVHKIDIVLLDYNQPVEVYGNKVHSRREAKDEKINKIIVAKGFKEPILVWHNGGKLPKYQVKEIVDGIEEKVKGLG
jgi:hypothetical protein